MVGQTYSERQALSVYTQVYNISANTSIIGLLEFEQRLLVGALGVLDGLERFYLRRIWCEQKCARLID